MPIRFWIYLIIPRDTVFHSQKKVSEFHAGQAQGLGRGPPLPPLRLTQSRLYKYAQLYFPDKLYVLIV